ncbi:MAG TPA: hypothetical protein VIT68_02495, partial [Candidatus Gracilibacteria bacterium]
TCEGNVGQLSSQFENLSTLVPTACDGAPAPVATTPTRLPSSGPAKWLIMAFLGVLALFCLGQMASRRA